MHKEWMTTDCPKQIQLTNLKREEIKEDHKRGRGMISERKEQVKEPKPYS